MNNPSKFEPRFMAKALQLACENVVRGGRPYGAVVVRDGAVVAQGTNRLHEVADPTEHAEMNAIRAATRSLDSIRLADCDVYASGQPCPMCLAALHLAQVRAIYFAYSNEDTEAFGLTTAPLYAELKLPAEQRSIPFVRAGADAFEENPFVLFAGRGTGEPKR